MLYSHGIKNNKINLFTLYLKYLVSGKEGGYKIYVDEIILETKELAIGKKDYYSIDRDSFDIVILLYERDADFFKNLELNKINKETYLHLLELTQLKTSAAS